MKKNVTLCVLSNGKFVEEWQYSQGWFDVVETDNLFEAQDFSDCIGHFKTFFEKRGARLVNYELIANIIN
jgi:hypothetical protein